MTEKCISSGKLFFLVSSTGRGLCSCSDRPPPNLYARMKIRLADKKRHSDGTKRTISSEKIIFFAGASPSQSPSLLAWVRGGDCAKAIKVRPADKKVTQMRQNVPFRVKNLFSLLARGTPSPNPPLDRPLPPP